MGSDRKMTEPNQPPEYPWKDVLAEAEKRADSMLDQYDLAEGVSISLQLMILESLATIIAIDLQRAQLAADMMAAGMQREKGPKVFDPRKGRQ
jgi:hypothetical protein